MKKQLLPLFALLLIVGHNSFAQDGMSIGTNATPNEMLDVNGAIKIGMDFTGNTGAPLGGAGTIRWNDTDDRFEGWDGSSWVNLSSGADTDWTVTGNDQYSAVSGNVGIGLNNPSHRLHVAGGSNTAQIGNGEIGTLPSLPQWTFFGNASLDHSAANNFAISQRNSGATLLNASSGQAIGFRIDAVEKMTLSSAGNFGIGITNPSHSLQVAGSNTAQIGNGEIGTLQSLPQWTYFGHADLDHSVSNNFAISQRNSGATLLNASTGQAIGFRINNAEQMLLSSAGNLGIGNNNPGAKLEVTGQVKITGGTPGANKVLTSDASGLATWAPVPSSADNLGNHTATTALDMNSNAITDINWSLSDDGSGSDLDADLLDGQESSFYLDNTDNQTAAEVTVTPSGNLGSTDVQAALQELQTDIDGIAPTIEDVLINGDVAADGQNLEIDKVAARDADGLSLTDDGSNGIFIEDGGNIGVGTIDPEFLVDVVGLGLSQGPITTTDNILARFEQNTAARGAGIQIKGYRNASGNVSSFVDLMNYGTPNSNYVVARLAGLRGTNNTEEGSLLFYTNSGSALTEQMRINSNGMVQLNAYTTNGIVRTTGANGTLAVSALTTSDIPAGSVTADNGLTVNTGNNVQLGGTLATDTEVALGGNDLTFSGTGNVGVGTNDPLQKLDVFGTTYLRSATTFDVDAEQLRIGRIDGNQRHHSVHSRHSADPASNYLEFKLHDGTGTPPAINQTTVLKLSGDGNVNIPGLSGSVQPVYSTATGTLTNTGPTTGADGYWTRTGTSVSNTTLSDNVGIGMVPTQKLDVAGTTFLRAAPGANVNVEQLRFGRSDNLNRYHSIHTQHGGNPTGAFGNYFQIRMHDGTAGGGAELTAFTIDGAGNVGIGTASPNDKLDVNGSIQLGYNSATTNSVYKAFATGHSAANVPSVVEMGISDGSSIVGIQINNERNGSFNDQYVTFSTHAGGASVGERMRIAADGRVGIGSTNPSGKLHVVTTSSNGNVANWTAGQFVVGQDGSQAGGIGISYSTTDNAGYISSLSPTVSWRDLGLRFNTLRAYASGGTERLTIEAGGNYRLALQSDNNLVYYTAANCAVWASGTSCSDIRKKDRIVPLESMLPIIEQLSTIRFHYKKELKLDDDEHIGVIAQEIEKFYPDMVYYDKVNDSYVVYYDKLTTVLIKGMQEQQEMIKGLQSENVEIRSNLKNYASLQSELEVIKQAIGLSDQSNR